MEHKSIYPLLDAEDNVDSDIEEPPNLDAALEEFRNQWQQELNQVEETPGGRTRKYSQGHSEEPGNEAQAKYLFLQGVQEEQKGNLYGAIQFYRRAVQLVPDIEFKIDLKCFKSKRRERQESESSVGSIDSSGLPDSDIEDLCCHFREQQITEDNKSLICQKQFEQKATHLSELPVEIVVYILKWVVSGDLDLRSLEQLSMVCRGFYLCARDDEIWRLVCLRTFGPKYSSCSKYGTWRNMFIEKPHLRFEGCYISKSTYYRQGEKGLDNFYKPWHQVEYFRYCRFFPDGKMLMLTSPDDPYATLSKLEDRSERIQGIMHGYYRLSGDKVTGMLKRKKTSDNQYTGYKYRRQRLKQNDNEPEQTFHVEFLLKKAGDRKNSQLIWQEYAVRTYQRASGQESVAEFELNNRNYSPLIFSRVRSYTASSQNILK